jgi:hypothetical protein
MKTKIFFLNRRIVLLVTSVFFLFAQNFIAQQKPESDFGISFSGFVKTDLIFDSRQTVNLREGHFLLYPANESKDKMGEDINAKSNFNILSIQSRLVGKIKGPDAFGAKTSGVIEAEFFGTTDGDINGFRLRHAYVSLKWENTSLLVGQTWHPMFIADVFPQVVSFNTGAPFQPFSRNPQVRLTQSFGNLNLIAALTTQRDFTSNGPSGFSSSYLRNSIVPDLHLQVQYKDEKMVLGSGVDFKSLTPRLETTKNYKTDNKISSYACLGYAKFIVSPFTLMLEGVYGKNLADLMMLGGYAVKSVDQTTGAEEYTNLKTYSIWSDISYGKEIQVGVFLGYSKNLGADDTVVGSYYTRVNNIDNILRVSPRILFNSGPSRIAMEMEYTSAAYGTTSANGEVTNTNNVNNLRLLLAIYYFFN